MWQFRCLINGSYVLTLNYYHCFPINLHPVIWSYKLFLILVNITAVIHLVLKLEILEPPSGPSALAFLTSNLLSSPTKKAPKLASPLSTLFHPQCQCLHPEPSSCLVWTSMRIGTLKG